MSEAANDDRIGQLLLDRLRVVRKIGGGGMGNVYEVEHLRTGHRRALKVVHEKYAAQPRFLKRLLREAKVAGQLDTPYVAETLDAGRLDDGCAYVLMELLRGRSMLALIQERGELEAHEIAWIAAQVCEGLAIAHSHGIVHRDLKPENIFMVQTPDGGLQVKVLDFGISKFPLNEEAPDRLTREGTILGTPFYMSPEQAGGRPVDSLTDVYALGVVMYEALAGRLPFESATVGGLFLKIGAGECFPITHYRPDLDEAFAEVVHRAFHRDPTQRYPSAVDLRDALVPYLDAEENGPGRNTLRMAQLAPDSSEQRFESETRDYVPSPVAEAERPTAAYGDGSGSRPLDDAAEPIAPAETLRSEPPPPRVSSVPPPRSLAAAPAVVVPEKKAPQRLFPALIVVAAVFAVGAVIASSLGPRGPVEADTEAPAAVTEPEAAPAPEGVPDTAPPEPIAEPAPEVEVTPEVETTPGPPSADPAVTSTMRRRRLGMATRPAEAAGLDQNPY